MGGERGDGSSEITRRPDIVRVEKRDAIRLRDSDPGIACRARPGIL